MKTIKISKATHKELMYIKTKYGYSTLDETIDMCIGEFAFAKKIEEEILNVNK